MITGSSERERIQRQSSRPSVPLALEVTHDDLADDRLVVDDQHGGHGLDGAVPVLTHA